MPEEFDNLEPEPDESPATSRRKIFSLRNAGILAIILAFLGLALVVSVYIAYRGGVIDTYVEDQFTVKMADMGIVFTADEFDVTISPFELHLVNATFNNKTTGEKLFFIRDTRLGLSVVDVFAWSLSRDISIDTTDINGAEVWIKFDENGNSNYSDLVFVEEEGARVNFRYDSIRFSLRDGVVHVNDQAHSISGDANNVVVTIEPEGASVSPELASLEAAPGSVPSEELRFVINASATDSVFDWDGSPLNEIDIKARGVAYGRGADVTELRIDSPIGYTAMTGKITDWAELTYEFNVESSLDLTQTSNTFPMESVLRGVANFKGKIFGKGQTYQIEGTADSQALSVDNVYLKAVNVEGTVAGTNANYEANGTAVAELLTYNDFRVEFPRMVGNIRGTGTDFRWVGELQAAAVKSGAMTIGNLYLKDATAELRDQTVDLSAGSGRAQRFAVGDTVFDELTARNLKFANQNGVTTVTAPGASAQKLTVGNNSWSGMNGSNLKVSTGNGQTNVNINGVTAQSSKLAGADVRDLKAGSLALKDNSAGTNITINDVAAQNVDSGSTHVSGVESPQIDIAVASGETKIYADQLRVAKILTSGAELGSLNIGGVRLSIREGRVEGTSNDIDAGNIALLKTETLPNGGTLQSVKLVKPVFVVEDSGRYRATFDMSIGGGMVGSVPLGDVRASVDVNNDRVQLNNLNGEMMNGTVNGNATIAFNSAATSKIAVDFANLDLETILSVQSGAIPPIAGKTTGRLDVTFQGTDIKTTTGTVNADIIADAGSAAQGGSIPVNGNVSATASNGLFTINNAKFNSPKSDLTATGQFDLRASNSNLHFALNSTDATEIERIFRSMGIAPDAMHLLDSINGSFAGNMAFTGDLTGNTSDPTLDGRASFDTFLLNNKPIGSVTTAINVSPFGVRLTDGRLNELGGGNATFDIVAPSGGVNNTTVQAKLTNINAGDLVAALPVHFLDRFGQIEGRTSGSVELSGLPDLAAGTIDLVTANGTIGSQSFQNLLVKGTFDGNGNVAANIAITSGGGTFRVDGTANLNTTAFNFTFASDDMPLSTVVAVLPPVGAASSATGTVDVTGSATGNYNDVASYNVNFAGTATNVVINDQAFGTVTLKGSTNNQILNAEMVVSLAGKPQPIVATINFGDPNLPFAVRSVFDQSPLGPFFALVPPARNVNVSGVGTGVIQFGGNLSYVDKNGVRVYSTENLTGEARFSSLALRIEETPLVATEPVVIRFDPRQMTFESASFAGGGNNVTVTGTIALSTGGVNNLAVNGRINLALLNVIGPIKTSDTFFGGFADVAMRLTGTYEDSQLSGSANLENASVATFVGDERLTFERMNGRIIFNSKQAQIERLTGILGGGEFTATGGMLFTDDLHIDSYRVSLLGNNVTIPYPDDFITTGDANLEVTGKRINNELATHITGNIRASRVVYSQDIDLATVISGRRDTSLSGGTSTTEPTLDITIEGRDALVVRNNLADLTASLALRVTGTAGDPQVTGRIVANSGQIFFRRDRYDIQRLVIEFPPGTGFEPVINLQAETEIAGYQISVNLSGPINDTEQLNASVRSSPALPQADVISLITTGSLSNTESGIPTLARTGINTAAEILADSIINNPVRRATDRLFGLNVFELDPIIAGKTLSPGARLTVGRQINNNLRVTYSTNLSYDQNQVLAFEYRISSTFSFVAAYEQRSLTNATHSNNNFSFGVRFRRRF